MLKLKIVDLVIFILFIFVFILRLRPKFGVILYMIIITVT